MLHTYTLNVPHDEDISLLCHKSKRLWVYCRVVSPVFFSAQSLLVQDHVTATGKRRRVSIRISPYGNMVPPVTLDTALTYSLDNHVSTALDNVLQVGSFFQVLRNIWNVIGAALLTLYCIP